LPIHPTGLLCTVRGLPRSKVSPSMRSKNCVIFLLPTCPLSSRFPGETIDSTGALMAGWGVSYFVQCKSCQQEIVIDRDGPEADTVTITGAFTAFPSCPHCGAGHQYSLSDVQTRAHDS
jgi:hypothetical protein